MAIPWTQTDVDKLAAAVASGVLSVEYDGPPSRRVQYQSLKEMRSLLAEMIAAVGNTAGTRSRFKRMGTSKGFGR